jgi:hypothetical protein
MSPEVAGRFLFPNVPESKVVSGDDLPGDLPQVVSEPIFHIPRLVKAARHQRFDPILRGGSAKRSDARIPPGAEFDIRRQAGVDEALCVGDRPFVERGDAGRQGFHECVDVFFALTQTA